jgi:hypothetical protein
LPSSLTRVISITLVFSTCPPVSVLVRARGISLEDFLGGMASEISPAYSQLASRLRLCGPGFSMDHPYTLTAGRPSPAPPSLPRPPIGQMIPTWYRNINLLSIDYAFRPRLRPRLTLSRRTLLRNPWAIGGGDSHPSFVTHAGILTSQASTAGFRRRFTALGTLSYRAHS